MPFYHESVLLHTCHLFVEIASLPLPVRPGNTNSFPRVLQGAIVRYRPCCLVTALIYLRDNLRIVTAVKSFRSLKCPNTEVGRVGTRALNELVSSDQLPVVHSVYELN